MSDVIWTQLFCRQQSARGGQARLFEVQTDRYLGQVECGDNGIVTAVGARGVVVAWRDTRPAGAR